MLVVLLLVAGVVTLLLSRGAYATYPRDALIGSAKRSHLPSWTRFCQVTPPEAKTEQCGHVTGRVVWIQKRDPDGDGDRHLIVVERLHPRIVKIPHDAGPVKLPSLGARVDAIGWLVMGGSGHREVHSLYLRYGGDDVVIGRFTDPGPQD
ncbi:MAG TPA: hypothetical protein VNT55_17865 [Baekduia sp.]|nr:hypothetical protein [Baekduia sp.]